MAGVTVQIVRELKDEKWRSWESWQACMTTALAAIHQAPLIRKYDEAGAFDLSVHPEPNLNVPSVVLYCDVKNTSAKVTCYLPIATVAVEGASRKGADDVINGALRACVRKLSRSHVAHAEWFTEVVRSLAKGQAAWERERDEATTLRLV